jgi:hypothetical protein
MSNRIARLCRSCCFFFALAALAMLLTVRGSAQLLINTTVTYGAGVPCINGISVGDFDKDGKVDVVLASGCSFQSAPEPGAVALLLGKGDGTFRPPRKLVTGGFRTVSVQAADVNGDGNPDLVTANTCATLACTNGNIAVRLGKGDGTFFGPIRTPTFNVGRIAVSDLNGDGKPDIVSDGCPTLGCRFSAINVRLGKGDGTFGAPDTYASTAGIFGIAISDVNQDDIQDIVISSATVGVMLGKGDGTFENATSYESGGLSAQGVTVADVNGDGLADIIVVNSKACDSCLHSSLGILLGNGDGTFQAAHVVPLAAPLGSAVASIDLNGDSISDMVVAHCTLGFSDGFRCPDDSGIVETILGRSDGAFSSTNTLRSGGVNAIGLAIADVNSDGLSDVLAANNQGVSNGNGTLGLILHNNRLLKSSSVAVASDHNPSLVGESVTFTATITAAGHTIPNGELVTFFDGAIVIGTAKTHGGRASFATSTLSPKQHTMKAIYSGDATFKPNASTVKQVVQK